MIHLHAKFQAILSMCSQNAHNPESTKFWTPKGQYYVNADQNRIVSVDGQDTSACCILDHSFHAYPWNSTKFSQLAN